MNKKATIAKGNAEPKRAVPAKKGKQTKRSTPHDYVILGHAGPDYVICGVRYDQGHHHIEKVQLREYRGPSLGALEEWTSKRVITKMKAKHERTFATIGKTEDDEAAIGQHVGTVTIAGIEYLRTDPTTDNLQDLERCWRRQID